MLKKEWGNCIFFLNSSSYKIHYFSDKFSNKLRPYMRRPVYSREQLCGVLVDLKEFAGGVVVEVEERAADVLRLVDHRLVRVLPRLDVHHGHACAQRPKVL